MPKVEITTLVLVGLAFALNAGVAVAGCETYSSDPKSPDHAPRAKICFSGKCETAFIVSECGNTFGTQIEYSNGWHVEYGDATSTQPDDKTVKVYRTMKSSDVSKLTCTDIDENACRFPDKP